MSVDFADLGGVSVPRFPGKYNAQVYDNKDPLQQFRIRCTVPYVLGDQISVWALPSHMSFGPQTGMFMIPTVGASVWIEFADGDPSQPVWSGGYPILSQDGSGMSTPASCQTGYPNVASIKSSSGHEITFNNNSNALSFTITSSAGHVIQVSDVNKTISVKTVGGHNVLLNDVTKQLSVIDSLGNKILMDANSTTAKIQQTLASGEKSLMQTVDHSIQHVASKVGLGDTAANLTASTAAALNTAALSAFESNSLVRRLSDQKGVITAMITAMATSGVPSLPSAAACIAQLASLAHISIPSGSTIVRIAQAAGDNVATGSG